MIQHTGRKRALRRALGLGAALASLPCLAACGKTYLLAHARIGEVRGKAFERDVRRTQNYVALAQNIRTVAFRAPDTCFTTTAGAATGVTNASGTLLTTSCAVWLAELERAVTLEGYRVISWDVLLRAERSGGAGSIYDVAKRLGADLVFILNSLEAAPIRGGADLAATFSYFHADPAGDKLGEFPLDDDQRRMLNGFMQDKIQLAEKRTQVMALSAILDTTGILASTGESVWYYRWGATNPIGDTAGEYFLYRGRGMTWRPVPPHRAVVPTMTSAGTMSSHDVISSSVAAQGEDAYKAEIFALVRKVAKDFVLNFRAGAH